MRMTSRAVFLPALMVLLFTVAACRQADGPLPTADGEVSNRLEDIRRDLLSVSRGDTQAKQDLADDLSVFITGADARPAVNELASRTADVVAGKTLNDQNAQQLAHHLWTATAAREMSGRQVESLQNDLHALLVSVGVPEDNALEVASQAGEVQATVTARPRRWYEFF